MTIELPRSLYDSDARRSTPLFELVTPIPYTQLQQMLDAAAPWGILAYEKALYLDELTDDVIDVVVEHTPRKHSPLFLANQRVCSSAGEHRVWQ